MTALQNPVSLTLRSFGTVQTPQHLIILMIAARDLITELNSIKREDRFHIQDMDMPDCNFTV